MFHPVDMWSAGCIFAELLGMQEESQPDPSARTPLFPGGSCPSLSRIDEEKPSDHCDQLSTILGVMGSPPPEDVEDLSSEAARVYVRSLPHVPAKHLSSVYRGASQEAIDLLSALLSFSPRTRVMELPSLRHPYLAR